MDLLILCRIANIDNRVKLISVKDIGPSDALNKAFNASRGIYIGWLNSDDLYLPDTLKRAECYLDNHPDKIMVYGKHVL